MYVYTSDEDREDHEEKLGKFLEEFKSLVRKYATSHIREETPREALFLARMQENTSVYSPYIWS